MADQTQRLEIATVKAEIGSDILSRFSNDAVTADLIPTDSGNIQNLKQVIVSIQEDGAEKISFASTIYSTTASGIAATTSGAIFLVKSNEADEIYAVWQNASGVATDTGKRAMAAQAIQDAMQLAMEAAQAAEDSADLATARTARFLASVSTPPVIRDDGTPLYFGDRYVNTENQAEYIYKESGWVANDSLAAIADLSDATDQDKNVALIGFRQSGAGAAGRTLKEKLNESQSINDYAGSTAEEKATSGFNAVDRLALPSGTHSLPTQLTLTSKQNKVLKGARETTFIEGSPNRNIITGDGSSNFRLSGFDLDCNHTLSTDTGHGITFKNCSDSMVSDITVRGVGGTGSAVIQYNNPEGSITQRIEHDKIKVFGNRAIEVNTNGVVQVDSHWGRMTNIYAEGIGQFPAEFKNDCKYSLLSNVQINGCRTGLYHGWTYGEHPSLIASANVVIKGADFSVYTGLGAYNSYGNILADADGSALARPEGVRLEGSKSAVWSLLAKSTEATDYRVVNYTATANSNYTKVAAHNVAGTVVNIETGAQKNVTEVAHPGATTTLLGSKVSGRSNAYGLTGNPVYSHALGEYLGNLSGAWKFVDTETGSSTNVFSTDIFRLESSRPVFSYILKAVAGATASYGVATPTTKALLSWNDTQQRWQIGNSAYNYYLTGISLAHSADNVASCGTAGQRWTQVYAATGSISTSDAREKQQIRELSDQEHGVAVRLKALLRTFKFNDAVAAKGEAARIHFGIIAQDVKSAFEAEGLVAEDYAVLCYDEWDEQSEIKDEEGNVSQAYRPAGNRYGVRYDELLALIISAL
jgi:hypothetical protein